MIHAKFGLKNFDGVGRKVECFNLCKSYSILSTGAAGHKHI